MSLSILKLKKSDLTIIDTKVLQNNSNGYALVIDNYSDSFLFSNATLQFAITPAKYNVPYIKEEEFCIVIRERADFSAIGPNSNQLTMAGEDLGEYKHYDEAPYRPNPLPIGFTELKGYK